MPILCEPAESAADLKPGLAGEVRIADSTDAAARMLDSDPEENLVVIGPATPAGDALAFAASLRLARPSVGVILTRTQLDVALLTQALQSGIREVVLAGDQDALADACRRSHLVSQRLRVWDDHEGGGTKATGGHVVTVFAGKGGCGKTTVATNLAVTLARHEQRVCIVDLDLAFGDVAITLQLDPVRTVVDALPMAGHLDVTGAASLLTSYEPGLDVLLAPLTPGEAEKISPELVAELLAVLRTIFDYVVVDTPPSLSEHVLTAMDASDHHVLVTTPDVLAVKNLRVALDTLDLLSYSRQTRSVILNRSDSRVRLSPEDVERGIRTQLAARLPSSRAVPACINKGVPIVRDSPRHAVSQAIARFAEQHLLPQPEPTKPRHRRGRKGPS